jgi:four helix bundle protein
MTVRHYRDLIAWQKAMDLVELIYRITTEFPQSEAFGLISQMRRAAVLIPSNIAEGQGRGAGKDFLRHLRIANGSLQELETQVLIAKRLALIHDTKMEDIQNAVAEVGRLVRGLARSIVP